ncbi:MAG: glucose-6-phosphate dehydrogenase [Proteobacteria bacterium]|nr:glucose-6-phosphate dehydrogenase [Pseudomonadota bacterium]
MIIAGASGDLCHRKLIPALFSLARSKLLPPGFTILGLARTPMSDDAFRTTVTESMRKQGVDVSSPLWESFAKGLYYHAGDYASADTWSALGARLTTIDEARGTCGNRLYYLAVPPTAFPVIIGGLGAAGLSHDAHDPIGGHADGVGGWVRIVIEKPFGRDLTSARQLQRDVQSAFREDQVFRIDHYLGKETVQNIMVLRFANLMFEPVWNRRYIDHVQITVAESLGVEKRGGYYEQAGALRDMIQNHLMQVLSVVAMEPPATFRANEVRDETAKLVRAIRPFSGDDVSRFTVRGQYTKGWVNGARVPGYRDEEGVSPTSTTETFAAARFTIDNWRWADVPFYVRSGKRLARKLSEIAIQFRKLPHLLFQNGPQSEVDENALVIRIQPDEGISIRFEAKLPGPHMILRPVRMDMRYGSTFGGESPDGYQRLLLDALLGDATLFARYDWVEASWTRVQPILDAWHTDRGSDIPTYEAGSWGPPESRELLRQDGRRWRRF